FIFGFLPILTWLPNYSIKEYLPGDLIGGITTAVVRIPQSLAYGLLAGVDPINGMYTAFFSPLTYTFLGTSKHVSCRTFAVISLMLGSALEKYVTAHPFVSATNESVSSISTTMANTGAISPELTAYHLSVITSVTILVGLIQVALGICNLGFVAVFLSDPLVAGFTTGAALFVFTAQVKYCFGINLARQKAPFALVKTYIELFTRIKETNIAEIILSLITVVVLYPVKLLSVKYKKKLHNIPIPIELLVIIVTTVISANVNLNAKYGIDIVGAIPSGLPGPVLPDATMWPSLLSDAFSIAIVGFAITVSVGKLFAKKHNYEISPNQELFALGMSQMTCGLFRGHACAGALARSTVKESSGTKTQFSDVVSCVVILLVLLFIGPLLSPLPKATLSCIIMVNVRGLFRQVLQLPRIWGLCKYDFSVWILTFVAVALLGVDIGLLIGVAGLLLTVVLRVYKPDITVRGGLGDTELYRDIKKFNKAKEVPGVKIIRFPQSPFFGNREALQALAAETISARRKHEATTPCNGGYRLGGSPGGVKFNPAHSFHTVVFDCSGWIFMDTMGMEVMKQICKDFIGAGLQVYLASMQPDIMTRLT
uniref:STAS domain-containing protein n=1 Tax=Ciona savignyi TaxID=51511 RepID=H2ZIG8_CIOSA